MPDGLIYELCAAQSSLQSAVATAVRCVRGLEL